jgi:putative transcriptional regulator
MKTKRSARLRYTGCCLPYDVWLKNGFTKKKTSHGVAVSVHDVEGLHRAIGLFIVKSRPELLGAEVRYLRKELDLSQKDLAGVIGVGETSIRNWESGRGEISKPADRLLRLLYNEAIEGDGVIREALERLSELNQDNLRTALEMKDTSTGWQLAA